MVLKSLYCWITLHILLLSGCSSEIVLQTQPEQPVNTPENPTQDYQVLPTLTPFSPETQEPITPTILPTQPQNPDPRPVDYHSIEAPPGMNPLTGLLVSDPNLLNRRPVMVKVANFPRSGRPQAGLSFADIVFEYYIGEEANRFLALYYGKNCEKVGPMRSGRLVDAQLTSMYQGFLAYANADPQVDAVLIQELGDRALAFNTTPCPAICGTDSHTVNDVFANTTAITNYANQKGLSNSHPDFGGVYFNPKVPLSEQFAINIGVEYSFRDRGEWHYDAASGLYLRSIEDINDNNKMIQIPLIDRLTGKQLAFSNVIILFAQYTEYAPTLHAIEIWDNTKGFRAVLFRDGIMIDGTWKSLGHQFPIQFYDSNGLPAVLKSGNTWIVIAGASSTLNQTAPGHWEMQFYLP